MNEDLNLLERLRTVEHFKHLSPVELTTIISAGSISRCRAGETIFNENDPCSGMFVLLAGRVHLCKHGPQGQVTIMSVIKPVIMFNEVAALDAGPNPSTAIAAQDCLIWRVDLQAFQALVEQIPQVGLSLLKVLARRNRELIARFEDLSFRPVLARTAKLLLDLSMDGQQIINRKEHPIEQLASRVCTAPEAISRSLNAIKEAGAIDLNRLEISIRSQKKLAELAHMLSTS